MIMKNCPDEPMYYEQNSNSEIISSRSKFTTSFILILFFAFIFFPIKKLPYKTVSSKQTTHLNQNSRYIQFDTILSNVSNSQVYSILFFNINSNPEKNPVKQTFYKIDIHYDLFDMNNVIINTHDRSIIQRFVRNGTTIPIQFIPLDDSSSIILSVSASSHKYWGISYTIFWEFGIPRSFEIVTNLHSMMFIIFVLILIIWTHFSIIGIKKLRYYFVTSILIFALLSHIPYEKLSHFIPSLFHSFNYFKSKMYRDIFATLVFGTIFIYYRSKAILFDTSKLKSVDSFKLDVYGFIMTTYILYEVFYNRIFLYTIPQDYLQKKSKSDIINNNVGKILIAFSFYNLLIEFFDRIDKLEAEFQIDFISDNIMFFGACVFNFLFFMTNLKADEIIANPFSQILTQIIWDLVAMYEFFASLPIKHLKNSDIVLDLNQEFLEDVPEEEKS